MTTKKANIKTNKKSKATVNNKKKSNKKVIEEKRRKRNNKLLIITFLTGVLLIVSSYAWLSASLNVRIKFFNLAVSTDNGLFISLDGVDYSDSIEISTNSVITDLKATYPNHTNQWAAGGLWPVSTNGIKNSNSDKFDIYVGEISRRIRSRDNKRFLSTRQIKEDISNAANIFISFDLFLKNVSGSPNSDNLYFSDDTFIDFDENTSDDIKDSMSNIMNSMRIGLIKMSSVPSATDVRTVQNLKCNGACQMVIYEPNSKSHAVASIDAVKEEYGINIVDDTYIPTYGVINEGKGLEQVNGHMDTGIPLDTAHFALQKTITNFNNPIFQIPNGVTKFRAYVWIEGQDLDSLETYSKGAAISIGINLEKDLSGYE